MLVIQTRTGRLLAVRVHAADVQDRHGAKLALKASRATFPFVETVFADGGYAGRLETSSREDALRGHPPRHRIGERRDRRPLRLGQIGPIAPGGQRVVRIGLGPKSSRHPINQEPRHLGNPVLKRALSRPGRPLGEILPNCASGSIELNLLTFTQLRTYHSGPATRVHEHRKSDRGSEASELTIKPDLSSHHSFATALHSPNDVTRGISSGAWRRVETMEGDEGFYGGAKIRWQRLDRVEGSLDPIGQQQFANAGLMRAKLVAEAFGSRSSSETSEFGSGHFDATDTNATP